MAENDTEIELKFAVDKDTFFKIKDKIKEISKFKNISKQVDDYFTPAHRNFTEPEYIYEWLRLGKRGSKTIITYKHFYPENVETFTHCDEFETEINSIDQLNKIFTALNLKKLVTIEKEREIYTNNEFEIAMDVVKELGYFIEIEAIKHSETVEETRKKLFEFAKNLGINSETDKRGYPYLLMKKKGLIN